MRLYIPVPLVALLIAAAWHALALGTQGLRGRIVHSVTAVGLLWGALTPPWGWAQIGAAVALVKFLRWAATDTGRLVLIEVGHATVTVLAAASMELAGAVGRAVRFVFPSPAPAHEEAPSTLSEPVPPRGDTVVATPQMMRWTPGCQDLGTAPVPPVTPIETYAGVTAEAARGRRPFNETAAYVAARFRVSRSKFARDVRAIREGQAA